VSRSGIEILDPRRDPEPAEWSAFRLAAGGHPPWDYGLLGRESQHAPFPTMLAVATVGGRLAGVMAASVVRLPLGARLLEVHNPWLSGVPGWLFADDVDRPIRQRLLRRMERALCRFAGPLCAGLLYRYLSGEDLPLVSGFGRLTRESVGVAVLDNTFSTVDDWNSSLARSRRHSVRGQRRKVERDPDLVVRFGPARDDLDGSELADLVNRHRARLGKPRFDSRGPVSGDYLHELVRRDDVLTLTYHDCRGRLLAFADLLDHPELPVYQHWAGLHRDEGGRAHLYFDSYARLIGHVVGTHRKRFSAGRGMLELKSSLGFTPQRRWIAAVPRPVAG
jgi:hypothetical protein